ncbi:phosphatase PAP2 family protein [Agrilactobacillus yilanensis]|uniref:Phosphatase PAP2 family protein n=1 Tax=Agrilactobacillus yilanensis TaxID=2485997 RepID=A0ABW4J5K1_9LACO|nr:phosphatase PAP2 family protein [Agrilactobacillus yilanensis]
MLISLLTNQSWIHQLDQWGHNQLQVFPHAQFNQIAIIITYLGQHEATIGLTLLVGAYLIWKKHYRWAIFLAQNIILGNLLNHIVKSIIQRPRPSLNQILPQNGYSFPSGHSANSVLLYSSILIILYYFIKSRTKRTILTVIAILIPILVGCSRVYLQVHYPSDVLAGWTSALGNLSLFYLLSRHFYLPRLPDVPQNDFSHDQSH